MQDGSEYCPDCDGASAPSPLDVRCNRHEIARLRAELEVLRNETRDAMLDIRKESGRSGFLTGATEAFKLCGVSFDIASVRAHALYEKRSADLRAAAEQAAQAQAARRGRA